MSYTETLLLLGGAILLALAGVVGEKARRRAPLAWYSHIPWNGAVFIGLALILFAAVHLSSVARAGGF